MNGFLRAHVPLIRTLALLAALLFAVGWGLTSLEKKDGTVTLPDDGWEWHPADSLEEAAPPPTGSDWSSFSGTVDRTYRYYWLRVPLPEESGLENPYLWIINVGSMKAFDEDRLLLDANFMKKGVRLSASFHWKLVPLPSPAPKQVYLLLRNSVSGGVSPWIDYGNKSAHVNRILHEDMDNIVLGGMLLFSCLISLGLYASHRDKLYAYFALLAFAGGYASLVRNHLLQFFWNSPWPAYLQDVCMPWATFATLGIMASLFPGHLTLANRILRVFMLVLSIAMTISAAFFFDVYGFLGEMVYPPAFLFVFCIVFISIFAAYKRRKDVESVWVLAGFILLLAIALIHILRFAWLPGITDWLRAHIAWINSLPFDLLFWGLFGFVICLIRVIMYRYTAMNRQLTEWNRSLEQVVQNRTHELKERNEQLEITHERLAATIRETSEALAETIILEEQHRITGTIHDAVGHTLTETIVQLEAAKRLLHRDRTLAESKLEASQSLVRRGLADIRQSVRLLKEDTEHYDLPGAVGALIRETEKEALCSIECKIGKLPESMSILHKRIVFQTLQEGLANGIRHGQARFFQLSLGVSGDCVKLRLSNDGLTYVPSDFGFGLEEMTDRAARLGGLLKVEPGTPGCVITLSLPVGSPVL
ncbi:7TM diverse intracellular signaling domain-containing protein [Cohnella faecalis]|uniref:histidine kinase n=1 Tax=Cohnella faecalis TaxID=2315694 RepID=A0A398CHG8_9BACL|nr:7TM diverse intracellular signaling domain-containing protein [Cohnella faecalis]RIE02203.1 hypothetical protein D3H35_15800 [Cohnella faecalis]